MESDAAETHVLAIGEQGDSVLRLRTVLGRDAGQQGTAEGKEGEWRRREHATQSIMRLFGVCLGLPRRWTLLAGVPCVPC